MKLNAHDRRLLVRWARARSAQYNAEREAGLHVSSVEGVLQWLWRFDWPRFLLVLQAGIDCPVGAGDSITISQRIVAIGLNGIPYVIDRPPVVFRAKRDFHMLVPSGAERSAPHEPPTPPPIPSESN